MPAYGSFWLVQNVRLSIKYFGNLPWESHLRKTKSKYLRSVDRSVVDLEYLTGKQRNCIEAWTGTGHLQSSSKEGCHGHFVNKFWQEHNLYCLCYGQRRNILIENLYDQKVLSTTRYLKCCRWAVQHWTLSDRNCKFQCFEKVHPNFLYYSVLENNALQRTTSNGVRDCGRWIAYSRRKTHNIILHTWCSLSLSYNSNLKIAPWVKIQHPANNT